MEDELTTKLNSESAKVTTLLGFLVEQPQFATSLTEIDKEKLMVENLVRVEIAKKWCDAMTKEIRSKCSDKTKKNIKSLLDCFEVNLM